MVHVGYICVRALEYPIFVKSGEMRRASRLDKNDASWHVQQCSVQIGTAIALINTNGHMGSPMCVAKAFECSTNPNSTTSCISNQHPNIEFSQTLQMSITISSTNAREPDEQWVAKYSHLLQPPPQIGDQVRGLLQTQEPGANVSYRKFRKPMFPLSF